MWTVEGGRRRGPSEEWGRGNNTMKVRGVRGPERPRSQKQKPRRGFLAASLASESHGELRRAV